MDASVWLWAVLVVVVTYLYGRENGRIEEAREHTRWVVKGEIIQHGDGNNCPPFIVRKEHHYPVLWCPFCGAECREAGVSEEASA